MVESIGGNPYLVYEMYNIRCKMNQKLIELSCEKCFQQSFQTYIVGKYSSSIKIYSNFNQQYKIYYILFL